MSINYPDELTPLGDFPIVRDTNVFGGVHVVADETAREAIAETKQKVGMLVLQQDTGVVYRLDTVAAPPNGNWTALPATALGGGYHIVADDTARNSLDEDVQVQGMLVYVQATGLSWILSATGPSPTYVPFNPGEGFAEYGVGVLANFDSGLDELPATHPSQAVVRIGTGIFFLRDGTRVVHSSTSDVDLTGESTGEYIIYYDTATSDYLHVASSVGVDESDFPLQVVHYNSGSGLITFKENVTRRCAGASHDKHLVTVGTQSNGGRGAMFPDLRSAVFYAGCFENTPDAEPHTIQVIGDADIAATSTDTIDVEGDGFLQAVAARLNGLRVIGRPSQTDGNQPVITIGTGAKAAFIFGSTGDLSNFQIEDLALEINAGVTATADTGIFDSARPGLSVKRVTVTGNSKLVFLARWASGDDLGGGTASDRYATKFEDVKAKDFVDPAAQTTTAPFILDSCFGSLNVDELHLNSTEEFLRIVDLISIGSTTRVTFKNPRIQDIDATGMFARNQGAQAYGNIVRVDVHGGEIRGDTGWQIGEVNSGSGDQELVKLVGTNLDGNWDNRGLFGGIGVYADNTPTFIEPVVMVGSRSGGVGGDEKHALSLISAFDPTPDQYTLLEEHVAVSGGPSERVRRYANRRGGFTVTRNAKWDISASEWQADNPGASNPAFICETTYPGTPELYEDVRVKADTSSAWANGAWDSTVIWQLQWESSGNIFAAAHRYQADWSPAQVDASAAYLHKQNIPRVWGTLYKRDNTTGAGSVTVDDGVGISSATYSDGTPDNMRVRVNFASAFSGTNYSVALTSGGTSPAAELVFLPNVIEKNASWVEIGALDSSHVQVDLEAGGAGGYFVWNIQVFGRLA